MRYLVALIIGIGVLFGVNYFADLFSMPRPWGSLLMGGIVGITMVLVLLIWEAVKPTHRDAAPAKPAMSEEERANARAERRARLAAEAGVSLEGIDGATSATTTRGTDPYVPETEPETAEAEPKTAEDKPDSAQGQSTAAESDDEADDAATGDLASDDVSVPPVPNSRPIAAAGPEAVSPEAAGLEAVGPEAAGPEREATVSQAPPESDGTNSEAGPIEPSIDARADESTIEAESTIDAETNVDRLDEPYTLAPGEFDEEATGSSLETPPSGEPGISVDALEDSESAHDDEPEGADAPEDTEDTEDPTADEEDSSRY